MLICKKGYQVKPLRSNAGCYMGTLDKQYCPNCRITGYARNEEEAKQLPYTREYRCIENEYCNGGNGCGIRTIEQKENTYGSITNG